MSRTNPYTQAAIQRAIRAAQASGLMVVGVKPDGTVLTEQAGKPAQKTLTPAQKPRDAREKLGVG